MRAYVGLGEGIGNVVMALPVVDSLIASGYEVDAVLRPTPASVAGQLAELIARPGLSVIQAPPADRYDLAALTYWYLWQRGPMPRAVTYLLPRPITDREPEVAQNLALLDAKPDLARVDAPRLAVAPDPALWPPGVGIRAVVHPGCKPSWRAHKWFRGWAEAVYFLRESGFFVTAVGSGMDGEDWLGRIDDDVRRCGLSLVESARRIAGADVFVSGDSGLLHVARALGVPTVAIFGATSPVKARHPGERRDVEVGPVGQDGLGEVRGETLARIAVDLVEGRWRE